MTPLLLRSAALALLFLPLIAACGDDDDGVTPSSGVITETPNVIPTVGGPQEQPDPAQELDSEAVTASDGVVEIEMADTQFTENHITMSAGEAVIIRVTNEDSTSHNLRVAGVDGQFETEDDAVTTPETIDGGQVGELTFAPPAAGAYTFQCDFHPTTMGGQIVVE